MRSENGRDESIQMKVEQEEWQTLRMKEHLTHLVVERDEPYYLPLNPTEVEDTTVTENQLALEFFPDVKLSGAGLYSEYRTSWGGAYYRVLKNLKDETKRCIQWVYVWTKQMAFFPFWMVLVAWSLGLAGLNILNNFSDNPGVVLFFLVLIGGGLAVSGALPFQYVIQNRMFYFTNSMLLIPLGLGFGLFWFELETYPTQPVLLGSSYRLSWIAIAYLVVGGVLGLLGYYRQKMHDMDWAPLFLYLKKTQDKWELHKVVYDSFHYFTEIKTKQELQAANALKRRLDTEDHSYEESPENVEEEEGKHVHLAIPNSWHSFELWRKGVLAVVLSVFLLLIAFLLLLLLSMDWGAGWWRRTPINARNWTVPGLILLGFVILYWSRPMDLLPFNQDLLDSKYHLTDTKLKIFWNLHEGSVLVIRSKLQNPFIADREFVTFRDTH